MPEERFETEQILRETMVDVERPVEVDGDGTPLKTESVELPANEQVEVVTCKRYPGYCPRRAGLVPTEEAVVVGVDLVDRSTGTDAAVALAYCPECAASEFDYVREQDDPATDTNGQTFHEKYGYIFGIDDRIGSDGLTDKLNGSGVRIVILLVVLGGLLAVTGMDGLLLWTILVTATAVSTALLVIASASRFTR